jgi:hypothetical protein
VFETSAALGPDADVGVEIEVVNARLDSTNHSVFSLVLLSTEVLGAASQDRTRLEIGQRRGRIVSLGVVSTDASAVEQAFDANDDDAQECLHLRDARRPYRNESRCALAVFVDAIEEEAVEMDVGAEVSTEALDDGH